jgi:hypothetical protein
MEAKLMGSKHSDAELSSDKRHSFSEYRPFSHASKRMRQFWQDFKLAPRTRVLDVGAPGTIGPLVTQQPCLTILNLRYLRYGTNRPHGWLLTHVIFLSEIDRSRSFTATPSLSI